MAAPTQRDGLRVDQTGWHHLFGCDRSGGAHHANEQPFVFHVLSETPEEAAESKGHYHIVRAVPA